MLSDIRAGVITKAWEHPDADKLWVENIDLGEKGVRQICSGLRAFKTKEQMEGARVPPSSTSSPESFATSSPMASSCALPMPITPKSTLSFRGRRRRRRTRHVRRL